MSETVVPCDLAAERAIIGGAIVSPSLLADLVRVVQPSDFHSPDLGVLFATIEDRHGAAEPIDANVLASTADVTDAHSVIADCIAHHGGSQTTLTHARRVAELAAVRHVQAAAARTLSRITYDGITDVVSLMAELESDLAGVAVPNDPRPVPGLWAAADLLSAEFEEPPWVAPGLLREGWRLLVVGLEGKGKSTLLRQIVAGISAGVHPFTLLPLAEAQTGLIIDVENPESVIRDGLKAMPDGLIDEADLTILARPGGIDIRQRRDRDLLHRVFSKVQPKVCSIGPLYKLYRTDRGESDEQAAVAAQNVLDDLRVQYGCAMVLETHAPKGGTSFRELIPFGSSAWLRWPELGWKLIPVNAKGDDDADGDNLRIGRFRGDRVETVLPDRLERGMHWPWTPYWRDPSRKP